MRLVKIFFRKLDTLSGRLVIGYVYTLAWIYSMLHARKPKKVEKVRKIACLWYTPHDLPGANLRMGYWTKWFEREGVTLEHFCTGELADQGDFNQVADRNRYYRKVFPHRLRDFIRMREFDVIWIGRAFIPEYPLKQPFLEKCLKRMGLTIVVDSYDGGDYSANPALVMATMKLADRVTVAHKGIYEFYVDKIPDVRWINWTIPEEDYKIKTDEDYKIKKLPVIGWMGSLGNALYLSSIEGELQKIASETPFKLIIICREPVALNLPGVEIEYHTFDESYYNLIGSFDIGISPVTETKFSTTAKISMKHQEFLLMGTPQVCSPIAISEHCVHGKHVLIAQDIEDWSTCIRSLLADENLRKSLGEESKKLFSEWYSYDGQWPILRSALLDW